MVQESFACLAGWDTRSMDGTELRVAASGEVFGFFSDVFRMYIYFYWTKFLPCLLLMSDFFTQWLSVYSPNVQTSWRVVSKSLGRQVEQSTWWRKWHRVVDLSWRLPSNLCLQRCLEFIWFGAKFGACDAQLDGSFLWWPSCVVRSSWTHNPWRNWWKLVMIPCAWRWWPAVFSLIPATADPADLRFGRGWSQGEVKTACCRCQDPT